MESLKLIFLNTQPVFRKVSLVFFLASALLEPSLLFSSSLESSENESCMSSLVQSSPPSTLNDLPDGVREAVDLIVQNTDRVLNGTDEEALQDAECVAGRKKRLEEWGKIYPNRPYTKFFIDSAIKALTLHTDVLSKRLAYIRSYPQLMQFLSILVQNGFNASESSDHPRTYDFKGITVEVEDPEVSVRGLEDFFEKSKVKISTLPLSRITLDDVNCIRELPSIIRGLTCIMNPFVPPYTQPSTVVFGQTPFGEAGVESFVDTLMQKVSILGNDDSTEKLKHLCKETLKSHNEIKQMRMYVNYLLCDEGKVLTRFMRAVLNKKAIYNSVTQKWSIEETVANRAYT